MVVNNERQQEKEDSGQKLPVKIVPRPLDGDRQPDARTSPLANAASKPMKADIIQCAYSISAGGRRGHIGWGSAL